MINNNGVHPSNGSKNIFDLAVANLARPEAFPKSFRIVNDLLWFVYGFDTTNQSPDMQIGWLDKKLSVSYRSLVLTIKVKCVFIKLALL